MKSSGKQPSLWRDYFSLLKPGIGVFITMAAYMGFALSEQYGRQPLWVHLAVVLLMFAVSGGSAVWNMVLEKDFDARMDRTRHRPFPTGRIPLWHGMVLGAGLIAVGSALAWWFLDFYFFLYTLIGAIVYIFVYTLWLKPRSTWNVPLGGLSGSFACLAGGHTLQNQAGWDIWLFALFLFFWSPAHFWNLGIYKREDYKKIDFPMLPARASLKKAAFWIFAHVVALVVVTFLFLRPGQRSWLFVALFTPANLYFLWITARNWHSPEDGRSKRAFLYSILYLYLAYMALAADLLYTRLF